MVEPITVHARRASIDSAMLHLDAGRVLEALARHGMLSLYCAQNESWFASVVTRIADQPNNRAPFYFVDSLKVLNTRLMPELPHVVVLDGQESVKPALYKNDDGHPRVLVIPERGREHGPGGRLLSSLLGSTPLNVFRGEGW